MDTSKDFFYILPLVLSWGCILIVVGPGGFPAKPGQMQRMIPVVILAYKNKRILLFAEALHGFCLNQVRPFGDHPPEHPAASLVLIRNLGEDGK